MADFALWATACETAFGLDGRFWDACCGNRDSAIVDVIEADPVAAAVRASMTGRTPWTGTATDLPGTLREAAGDLVLEATSEWQKRRRQVTEALATLGILERSPSP